jgi:hypothetical protein
MQTLPFKLSKLSAAIGGVLWWYAYAAQVQAAPFMITAVVPLAPTWCNSTHEGHAKGGPLSSNLPHAPVPEGVEGDDGAWPNETPTPPGYTHVPGVGDYPTAYVEQCDAERGEGMPTLCDDEGCPHSGTAHVCTDPTDARAIAAEVPAQLSRVLTANETAKVLRGEMEPPEGAHMKRDLPKRIRVRSKPLTAADIVEGGEYVPKRGNDKTPNLYVASVGPDLVAFRSVRDVPSAICQGVTMTDFLALVSRRIGA